MAHIRVTSKSLKLMAALCARYGEQWERLPKVHWWWIRPRYEMRIPIEHRASLKDFSVRADIAKVSYMHGHVKYELEIVDGEFSGKLARRF